MNTFLKTHLKLASFSHRIFMKFHDFFGIDFRIDFFIDFSWKRLPKRLQKVHGAGDRFAHFSRPCLLCWFMLILCWIWLTWAPFWLPLAHFWLPLAHFWLPLAPFGSLLAPFWVPLAHFYSPWGSIFSLLASSGVVFLSLSYTFDENLIKYHVLW